ncbi:MAG: hypothetical protein ChlgKO_03310 [Chlamydiales bacterium]
MQLDEGERGFSFQQEGPLDMRMDKQITTTAEEIVNRYNEKKLGDILRDYGEEPKWRQYAKAIVAARKKKRITTTKELANVILESCKGIRRRIHPATLVFQGLRLFVNKELESAEEGLKKAMDFMAPGGKMGVISFHSLEDRIVKNLFREASKPLEKMNKAAFENLTKKPIVPTRSEIMANSRARSAKLRALMKNAL